MKTLRSLIALILCISMVLGILPVNMIGEDIARAAVAVSPAEYPEFQELLEQPEAGQAGESGEWQYRLYEKGRYAVITGHTDLQAQDIRIPDQVDGADVVAVADDAFAGHDALVSVTLPVNIYAMGPRAIPRGVAVCAANASYGQTWARQNGRAFRNTSELEFRSGVIDLAETRPENFVRFSSEEIMLRELEAKRLQEGDLFFLPDPSNLYQISYYRAEHISEAENGFVTIRCSTPQIEEAVTHISAENQVMMPDYSTLKLEPGVELAGGQKRASGSNGSNMAVKVAVDKKFGDLKLYLNVSISESWNTTYDISLFGDKIVKVTETSAFSVSGGVETKQNWNDKGYEAIKDNIKNWLKEVQPSGAREKVVAEAPLFSVMVFSLYGVVNIMADFNLTNELSGKIEISYSSSSTITYKYQNGELTKEAKSGKREHSLKAEANYKVGPTASVDLYLLFLKVASLKFFAGISITATYAVTAKWTDDMNPDTPPININMLDCINVSAKAVVEFGWSFGAGDWVTFGKMYTILSLPLLGDDIHFHLWSKAYRRGTNGWEPDGDKDMLHYAGECPYDTKTVAFKAPTRNGGSFRALKTIDDLLPGSTVEAPGDEAAEIIRKDFNRKLLSWHTSMDCTPDTEVAFPATIDRISDGQTPTRTLYDKTTLYAKTSKYHMVELINSAGKTLGTFNAEINRGGDTPESWISEIQNIAGGETITLPTAYTLKQHDFTIRQWCQVDSKANRLVIGPGYNPGDVYEVEDTNRDTIYLMALTDEDVVGHFVRSLNDPTQTVDVYCEAGWTMVCPQLNDTVSSEFTGWTVTATDDPNDTVIATLAKGENFLTSGQTQKDFTFYPNWTEKQNINFSNITGPVIGSLSGYSGGTTNPDDLIISGERVEGIRSSATVTHLSIPRYASDGTTMITSISSDAFSGNQDLRSVYIPDTVTSIGPNAFSDCPNLKYILTDSSGITFIPDGFASGCSNLLGVSIPAGLERIGVSAFAGCTKLTSIRLNSNIGSSAFNNCSGLTSITLGGACREIGYNAFGNCTGLTEVTIPNCVDTLGEKIFLGCTNITKLTIAARTTLAEKTLQIGQGSKLAEIALEDGVTGLGYRALANDTYGFDKLTKVSLPMTLKSVGANVFENSGIKELSLYMPMTSLSGMLSMANYAFSGMHELQTLTVQGGKIPSQAFAGNENLRTVTILSGKIGYGAFYGCTRLETVNLGEGVVSIGDRAFEGCSSLTSLRIPDSVTSIGSYFLRGCKNLTTLEIGGGIDNLFTEYSYYPFYIGPDAKLNTLKIGEGVTEIGSNTFTNSGESGLATTYFPLLTNLTLPSSLKTLGANAFKGSNITELNLAEGLASAYGAFQDQTTLEKVTIRGGEIGTYAFRNCTGLREVIMEEGVTSIGYGAFYGCSGLGSLTIPDSVTTLESNFIQGCTNITKLTLGSGVTSLYTKYNYYPFYIGPNAKLDTLIIGEGVTEIGGSTFTNSGGSGTTTTYFPLLRNLTLPSTLTSLGAGAFIGSSIKELDLAEGLASTYGVLQDQTSLEKVTIRGGAIGSYAFKNCSGLKEIILEEGVTSIGYGAFYGCAGLTSLTIPDSVTELDSNIIQGCTNVTTLTLGSGVTKLYTEYNYYPFYIGPNAKLDTLIIGEGVTEIGGSTFTNSGGSGTTTTYFPKLQKLVLPSTLTSLGANAFKGSDIKELDLAEGLASTYGAFRDQPSLKKVTIRGGAIGDYAFSGCTGLEEIILEEGVTEIGYGAFYGCTGLTSLTIPDSVTTLESNFLQGCINLETLKIGSGIPRLCSEYNYYPFYIGPGSRLNTLIIGEGVTEIGGSTFTNSGGSGTTTTYFPMLRKLVLPSTLTTLGANAFNGSNIKELELAEGLASVYGAFRGQANLEKVTIKGGEIGDYAFASCTGLKEVILKEGVTAIGYGAFDGCSALTSLTIPNSVTTLESRFIAGCTGLLMLKIGNGISNLSARYNYYPFYIGPGAALKTLVLAEGITEIGSNAFENYGGSGSSSPYTYPELEYVSLPSTLQTIASGNLCNWSMVKTLCLPDGLSSISDSSLNASSGMVLYSRQHNQVIDTFAQQKGLTYIWLGQDFPVFHIKYAAPSTGMRTRGLLMSDGNLRGTRGTEGEETAIPEGFAILNEADIMFTDPVSTEDPAYADGYGFYGWYTDPEFTMPWQMDSMPAADLTLYAKIKPLVRIRYAINLEGENDGTLPEGFSLWQEYRVRDYSDVPQPADPAPDGYSFDGWYTDADLKVESVPKKVTTEDITVYGKVTKAPAGAVYQRTGDTYVLTGYRKMEDEDETVRIPAKVNGIPVTSIGAYAFRDSGAKAVRLPDSVTDIDRNAFTGSEVHTIYISQNNAAYTAKSGALYSKDGSTLIRWPDGKKNAKATLPEGVVRIGSYAFENNRYLTEITFNSGLEEIGQGAFSGCENLQRVVLPDNVTSLEDEVFAGCNHMTFFQAYGLTAIGTNAIPTSTGMEVRGPIGDNPLRRVFVTETGDGREVAWGYNQYTVKLYVDGTLTEQIGSEAGQLLTGELKNVTFADGTQILAWYKDSGFGEEWDLDTDVMPEAELKLYASKTQIYSSEETTLTVDGTEITGVILTAYYGKAQAIAIPETYGGNSVIALGGGLLSTCSGSVSEITIPAGIRSIGDNALVNSAGNDFSGTVVCDSDSYAAAWAENRGYATRGILYRLTLQEKEDKKLSYDLAKGTEQRLPSPARTGETFLGWFEDAGTTIPAELTENCYRMPGEDRTLYAGWEKTAEALNLPFIWEENEGSIIITGYTGNDRDVTIPAAICGLPVTAIGNGAFSGQNIWSIDLGSVSSIGEEAFANCTSLARIALPDSVTSLGEQAFAGCEGLKAIQIGSGLAEFPVNAIRGCSRMTTFTVAAGNEWMSAENGVLFSGDGSTLICYAAGRTEESYTIPNGTAWIGPNAFRDARLLEEVILPGTLTDIGDGAFTGCTGLESIDADGLMYIGERAFFGCTGLTGFDPGNGLQSIGQHAFLGCDRLTEIHIPESATLTETDTLFTNRETLVITGRVGSSAWTYAQTNGIAFNDPDASYVTAISLEEDISTLRLGETVPLTLQFEPADAVIGKDCTWSVENERIAFVDGENRIRAVGTGETTLNVKTGNGVRISIPIEVYIPVGSLTLQVPYSRLFTMAGYGTETATATVAPANATDPSYVWESSNPAVVMVDEEGNITAVGAGTAQITVRSTGRFGENRSRSMTITVSATDRKLTLPASLGTIMDQAFEGDTNVQCIVIPNTTTVIGERAFANMSGLVLVIIPGSVTEIAGNAFSGSEPVIAAPEGSEGYQYAMDKGLTWIEIH